MPSSNLRGAPLVAATTKAFSLFLDEASIAVQSVQDAAASQLHRCHFRLCNGASAECTVWICSISLLKPELRGATRSQPGGGGTISGDVNKESTTLRFPDRVPHLTKLLLQLHHAA